MKLARGRRALFVAALISFSTIIFYPDLAFAAVTNKKPVALNLFQRPQFEEQQRQLSLGVLQLFQQRRYAEAENLLRKLIQQFPEWSAHDYNLAAALARQNKIEASLQALEQAMAKGFANRAALERDPDLNAIRNHPRFKSMLDKFAEQAQSAAQTPRQVAANKVEDGTALVDQTNTIWEPTSNTLISGFAFPEKPQQLRVRAGDDPISRRLNLLFGSRKAAGNHGDLYDNRDRGHSSLRRELYPQFTHVKYSAEAIKAGLDYGVNAYQLFNAITIGNSSTAVQGKQWRSQARLIQTKPGLIARAFQQYANDHLYVYPEHRDYDVERGDLFPANTPYMLVSKGSSGSDQAILNAISAILASFDPDVKRFLRSKHLVAPTVQMIFRSGLTSVQSTGDYLTGKAHPPVFEATDLDLRKVIFLANSLRQDEVPPRVNMTVVQETLPNPGVTYFGPSPGDEALFNTPSAIARVVRSTDREKRMVVSTAGTQDPNGRSLTFEWRVLQGQQDLIDIIPRKENGSEVELRVNWHDRQSVTLDPKLMTSRVDIAVFAHNGVNYSAPAFVSLLYPTHQQRTYGKDGKIREVDYRPVDSRATYQDPLLFAQRDWRDVYKYTEDGRLIGWERIMAKGTEHYTHEGARVVATDAFGRPVKAEKMRYAIEAGKSGAMKTLTVPTGESVSYQYQDDRDLIGTSTVMTKR